MHIATELQKYVAWSTVDELPNSNNDKLYMHKMITYDHLVSHGSMIILHSKAGDLLLQNEALKIKCDTVTSSIDKLTVQYDDITTFVLFGYKN